MPLKGKQYKNCSINEMATIYVLNPPTAVEVAIRANKPVREDEFDELCGAFFGNTWMDARTRVRSRWTVNKEI